MSIVKENKDWFPSGQINGAKKAIQTFHATECPTTADLKSVIRMDIIRNNVVTTEDIALAEKIYGKDIAKPRDKATKPNEKQ